MFKSFFTTRRLARAGIIFLQPFSFGIWQFRASEALTVLPAIFPEAIPALFVGCLIANVVGNGIWDIFIGSFATLIAATLTYITAKAIKNIHLKLFASNIFARVYYRSVDYRRGGSRRRIYARRGFVLRGR